MTTSPRIHVFRTHARSCVAAAAAALICCLAPLAHAQAQEAALLLEPSSGVYPVGEVFEVKVLIDTGGTRINAAEGTLTYNTDDLQIVSISTKNSIFSMWMEEPAFDNQVGRVRFSGGTRSGYAGGQGLVMTLAFRAQRSVASQVWFSQGAAVHAADGQGSNVLSGLRSGTYTLTARDLASSVQYVTLAGAPGRVSITSPTHPDPEAWYATSTVILRWDIPQEATAMRTTLDQSPTTVPTKVYPQPVSQVVEHDLPDGASYFHLQFQSEDGWGEITHRKIQVDTTAPEQLSLAGEPRQDERDPRAAFSLEARDAASGIDRFEMVVDDNPPQEWDGEGLYRPSNLAPGEHTLTAYAYDRADNRSQSQISFTIGELEPPQITQVPQKPLAGDTLVLQGTTYPNAEVTVTYRRDEGEPITRSVPSEQDGSFAVVLAEAARAGTYEARFAVTDERGGKSKQSEPVSVSVSQPRIVLFGSTAVSYLSVIVPLVGLLVLLGLVLWWGVLASRRMRREVHDQTREVEDLLSEGFVALESDMEGAIAMLKDAEKKRGLTSEERIVLERLSGRIDTLRNVLSRELADIDLAAGYASDEVDEDKHAPEESAAHKPQGASGDSSREAEAASAEAHERARKPETLRRRRASPGYRRYITNLKARRQSGS